MLAAAACALLLGRAGAVSGAEAAVYRVGPVPSWVNEIAPDYGAPPPDGDRKVSKFHVLLDNQWDVRRRGNAHYRRTVVKLVNESGAEDYSQISIYADPGYEHVTLHGLRVIRDGRPADRLAATKVTVLPVESDLQSRIYSGLASVNLLVPDLRAGDVLDYAYTLDTVNPNFPGHFAAGLSIAWSEPVLRQRVRVRHFPDDPVQYRVRGGSAEPVVREREGRRELGFEWRDLRAKPGEADMPDWYPHWPVIEFSNAPDWHDVAAKTAALYREQAAAGPRTRAAIAKLKAMPGSDADRALAALRMTQDNIRYASISIGPGSYRPHQSDLVLERNFGDCKDKSLLLVNLLQGIGLDARVALVNTVDGHALPEKLPTSMAFDHAIVRARVGSDVLWLDPTASLQGGMLAKSAQADFEYALVVDPATTALEAIPRPTPDTTSRDVLLLFDLTAGVDKPGKLEVRTRFQGRSADSMRADIADRNVEERTTDYLNYYASRYPGIQSEAPIFIEDDPVANVILTREHYRLARAFRERTDEEDIFEILPDELYGYAEATDTPKRTAPLVQPYPARVTQRFEVRLPESWPIRNSSVRIDNPAFLYQSKREYAKNVLKMAFSFESRSDLVPIERVPKYLADQKRMDDDLGYQLTYRAGGQAGSGIAPYPLVAALLGLVTGLLIALRWMPRYDPPPRPLPVGALQAPEGIGGWLALVALSVIGSVAIAVALAVALMTMSTIDVWENLPATSVPQFAAFARHGLASMQFLTWLLLPCNVLVAVLFFRKRTSAPMFVIASFWLMSLYGIFVEQVTNRLVPGEEATATNYGEIAGQFLGAIIWTRYMLVSKRVVNTFVRRRSPQTAQSREGPAPLVDAPTGAA